MSSLPSNLVLFNLLTVLIPIKSLLFPLLVRVASIEENKRGTSCVVKAHYTDYLVGDHTALLEGGAALHPLSGNETMGHNQRN